MSTKAYVTKYFYYFLAACKPAHDVLTGGVKYASAA
jgi:hypothetical protein